MILQALKELAEREVLIPRPHYEMKEVSWLVHVGPGGKLLGLSSTVGPDSQQKGRPRPKRFLIPQRSGRTSGEEAEFLVDKAEYVFGVGDRDEASLQRRQRLFFEKVAEAAHDTGDEGIETVREFLKRNAQKSEQVELPEEMKSNDLFAFVYSPDKGRLVSDRPKVIEWWTKSRQASAGTSVCLICGTCCMPVEKHPQLKMARYGGSPSGVALVSFNEDAFESFGLARNSNAPICQACADGYTTGLNRLLDPAYQDPKSGSPMRPRNVKLSDNTVAVFWAGDQAEMVDVFSDVLNSADPEAVNALFGALWKGRMVRLDVPSAFYAAVLSGARGRATMRGWFLSTVAEVAENLKHHFDDLAIVDLYGQEHGPLPLWRLLRTIAVLGKAENITPHLATEVFHSALTGGPYPWVLIEAAVRRLRAEGTTPRERMALIKAVLNRRRHFDPMAATRYKEVTREMDATNTNTGYRLGRLLAVLEHLQGRAIGNPGATIVDRYFGAASTTPRRVFPSLLKLAQAHAGKLGGASYHQKLIGEILEPISPSEGFPATLSLENQGLFALGYYHQRAELWKKREASVES